MSHCCFAVCLKSTYTHDSQFSTFNAPVTAESLRVPCCSGEEKEEKKERITTAVLSTTAKAKAKAQLKQSSTKVRLLLGMKGQDCGQRCR